MKCQLCNEREATVFIKHVAAGEVSQLHVCATCAEQKGLDVQIPTPLLNELLYGTGGDRQPAKSGSGNRACPVCHMRRGHFRKTSLLGCPACYETFREDVAPFLEDAVEARGHVGKVPRREQLTAEIAALEQRLHTAVGAQNYEEAALLRDRLRDARRRDRGAARDAEESG
jgi:protein arginine kinase activator